MSDQQLDDYISHVLAAFLEWVIEGQGERVGAWEALPEHKRRIYTLRKAIDFMALYNQARLEVEEEIA